jgi:uridine kinase
VSLPYPKLGKTTLAKAILDALGSENITYIPHDNYYKDLSHLTSEERDHRNFDHPDALDTSLLVQHLHDLKLNKRVCIPLYDFKTHTRLPGLESLAPRRVILVEGVLIFADRALAEEMDIKIFVDTDADIRFIRRMQRDRQERQRSVESVIEQYMSTVRPMHDLFVEPSKRLADIIIPSGYNAVALDLVAHRLRSAILSTPPSVSNEQVSLSEL